MKNKSWNLLQKKANQVNNNAFSEIKLRISELEDENKILQEKLACSHVYTCDTMIDGRTYSDNLRETIYLCISKNVALSNLSDVIIGVLQKMVGVTLTDFPDVTTCRRISREMGVISRLEIAEELVGEKSTTIKYDGTTKAKQHWIEAQVME